MAKPKLLFYDIETSDLDADFGNMIAFGYKWAGEKHTFVDSLLRTNKLCRHCKRVDATSDAALVKSAWTVLAEADVWCTWYGKGFDLKYLNTRILDAGLPPLPPTPHVDLYWTARTHLKLSSNRLASVQNFLQLPTKKTPITKREWRRAQAGDVQSIKYIVEHCQKDVLVLEEAYERLKGYVRTHPYTTVSLGWRCRVCNGKSLERRGTVMTKQGRRQRYQCKDCGYWSQGGLILGS